MPRAEARECARCGETKPSTEFRLIYRGMVGRDRESVPGSLCRGCQNARRFPRLEEDKLHDLNRQELMAEVIRRRGPLLITELVRYLNEDLEVSWDTGSISTAALQAEAGGLVHVAGWRKVTEIYRVPLFVHGPRPEVITLPPGFEDCELERYERDARSERAIAEAEMYRPRFEALEGEERNAVLRASEAMREYRRQVALGRYTGFHGVPWAVRTPDAAIRDLFRIERDDRREQVLSSIAWAMSYLLHGDPLPISQRGTEATEARAVG
jgi:hypothetical protein